LLHGFRRTPSDARSCALAPKFDEHDCVYVYDHDHLHERERGSVATETRPESVVDLGFGDDPVVAADLHGRGGSELGVVGVLEVDVGSASVEAGAFGEDGDPAELVVAEVGELAVELFDIGGSTGNEAAEERLGRAEVVVDAVSGSGLAA
jgi:hypothetical protein